MLSGPPSWRLLQLRKSGALLSKLPVSETRREGLTNYVVPELPGVWTFRSSVPQIGTNKAVFEQVEVPPREQTELNHGHTAGTCNPEK